MATRPTEPLLVIVGPTASGKTNLAISLARQFDGEIICADSRTIYKGMDIATAKPSAQDRQKIPHHLLDVTYPDEPFTVADFKVLAEKSIADIRARNKLPIIVGGSGLYINALLYNYGFTQSGAQRSQRNPRHLEGTTQVDDVLRADALIIGIQVSAEELNRRIAQRVDDMFSQGLLDEALFISRKYGWDIEAMKTYLPLRALLEGKQSLEQTKSLMLIKDRQVAKKQRTWLRRNNSIHWLSDPSKYVDFVTTLLNNKF